MSYTPHPFGSALDDWSLTDDERILVSRWVGVGKGIAGDQRDGRALCAGDQQVADLFYRRAIPAQTGHLLYRGGLADHDEVWQCNHFTPTTLSLTVAARFAGYAREDAMMLPGQWRDERMMQIKIGEGVRAFPVYASGLTDMTSQGEYEIVLLPCDFVVTHTDNHMVYLTATGRSERLAA